MKKTILFPLLLGAGFIALMSIQGFAPPPPTLNPLEFEQEPPIAEKIWVRKLATPLDDGSNMVMKIKYPEDSRLQPEMEIFYGDDQSVWFYDNGSYADETAGDGVYTAYIEEDIPAFVTRIQSMENNLLARGSYLRFTGHVGEYTSVDEIVR